MATNTDPRELAAACIRDYEKAGTDAERTRVWQEATLGLLAVLVELATPATVAAEPTSPGRVLALRSAPR